MSPRLDANGFKLPPDLHQGPKKRAAKTVKVYPSSPAQREAWEAEADAAGLDLSAWFRALANHASGAPDP